MKFKILALIVMFVLSTVFISGCIDNGAIDNNSSQIDTNSTDNAQSDTTDETKTTKTESKATYSTETADTTQGETGAVSCPYCGSSKYTEISEYVDGASGDLISKVKCLNCGEKYEIDMGPVDQYN